VKHAGTWDDVPTNQALMLVPAADRMSPKMAAVYDPLHIFIYTFISKMIFYVEALIDYVLLTSVFCFFPTDLVFFIFHTPFHPIHQYLHLSVSLSLSLSISPIGDFVHFFHFLC
jgi:hypothetical protein